VGPGAWCDGEVPAQVGRARTAVDLFKAYGFAAATPQHRHPLGRAWSVVDLKKTYDNSFVLKAGVK